MHFKKLTIVSDTALYNKEGCWYGFNAVVNEIEGIEDVFDSILWIGVLRKDLKNSPTLKKIETKNIKIIPLNFVGGKGVLSKIKILFYYPIFCLIILKHILNSDVVHTRLPSHPAFIATILSFFMKNKIWWHKFAGSWDTNTLPFFYKLQRNILVKANHSKVTINGFWENQPKHCLSFENPCLTENQIEKGLRVAKQKTFDKPFVFTFVGRLEEAKGVSDCIEALQNISIENIEKVHFIGDGENREYYKKMATFLGDKVEFYGFLESKDVHSVLEQSHFLLLPSKSEGFPKVIAEAACYGVIPIVSNVGSISHYINSENGFIWDIKSGESFSLMLQKAIKTENSKLKEISNNSLKISKKFTFSHYVDALKETVLKYSKN